MKLHLSQSLLNLLLIILYIRKGFVDSAEKRLYVCVCFREFCQAVRILFKTFYLFIIYCIKQYFTYLPSKVQNSSPKRFVTLFTSYFVNQFFYSPNPIQSIHSDVMKVVTSCPVPHVNPLTHLIYLPNVFFFHVDHRLPFCVIKVRLTEILKINTWWIVYVTKVHPSSRGLVKDSCTWVVHKMRAANSIIFAMLFWKTVHTSIFYLEISVKRFQPIYVYFLRFNSGVHTIHTNYFARANPLRVKFFWIFHVLLFHHAK